MVIPTILGWAGAVILLVFFFLNLFKILPASSLAYKIANFLGASILVYSAFGLKAYPFFFINSVWAIVSFISLFHKRQKNQEDESANKQ